MLDVEQCMCGTHGERGFLSLPPSMMQHLNEEEDDDDDDDEVPILQDLDLIPIGERSEDNVVDDAITKNNLNDDNDNGANNNNSSNQHHQQLPRVPVTILTGFLGSGT